MKKIEVFLALFAVSLLFYSNLSSADEIVPGKIIIKFKPGYEPVNLASHLSGNAQIDSLLVTCGVNKRTSPFSHLKKPDFRGLKRVCEFQVSPNSDIISLAQQISKFAGVEYSQPIYQRNLCGHADSLKSNWPGVEGVPNDPFFSLQWYLPNVDAPSAWDVTEGEHSVIIAIVDNGVDLDHPDLSAQIWVNPGETPNDGVDNEGNGYIDDVHGWDFFDWDSDPNPNLAAGDQYHGTHVAGIAGAALNNSRGVAGIAPECKLMPVKVGEGGLISYGYAGIIYAYENGAQVINLSWGGYSGSPLEEDAIANANAIGVLVVAAAGNDNVSTIHYPSAYPGVMAVAATSADNSKASFSNFGSWVTVSAPGDYLYSTIVLEDGSPNYAYLSGTSMASPLVAGLAGLVFSANPGWYGVNVFTKIINTCDDISSVNPAYPGLLGAGKVNAFQAVGDLLPGLRLDMVTISDSTYADGDGIPEAGETLEMVVTLENVFQDAEGVTGVISTTNPHTSIIQGSVNFGDIPADSTVSNADQPYLIQLGAVQPVEEINFDLALTTVTGFEFNKNFTIIALPPYANHNIGNVTTTVTNFGALGYQNYPYTSVFEQIGQGFRYPPYGPNALYHGSMVLGANSNHVASAIYRENIYPYAFEWDFDEYMASFTPGVIADQETHSHYFDHNVFYNQPGTVEVEQNTYAWQNEPVDDFVILQFKYTNASTYSLYGLYSGIFMDWDIGYLYNNSVDYSQVDNAGYMFGEDSYFYGVAVLSEDMAVHRALNNSLYLYGGVLTDAMLYQFLSGVSGVPAASGGDFSHLVSVGPFDLAPGEEKIVAYALAAGDDYFDFINNVHSADSIYSLNFTASANPPLASSAPISLSLPKPNPFNQALNFELNLSAGAEIEVSVFDILGRETADIFAGSLPAGNHRFRWDAGELASGIYFLKASAPGEQSVRRLILIK